MYHLVGAFGAECLGTYIQHRRDGEERASTRCRVRAALSIDFPSRDEAAGRPDALMLYGGAQLGGYLHKGSV
jgi:hypothetical protein